MAQVEKRVVAAACRSSSIHPSHPYFGKRLTFYSESDGKYFGAVFSRQTAPKKRQINPLFKWKSFCRCFLCLKTIFLSKFGRILPFHESAVLSTTRLQTGNGEGEEGSFQLVFDQTKVLLLLLWSIRWVKRTDSAPVSAEIDPIRRDLGHSYHSTQPPFSG